MVKLASKIDQNIEDNGQEFIMDEVKGAASKKPILSVLNKGKLSKYEMDDLFLLEE